MIQNLSLSIILPVYNEEENIKKVIKEIDDFFVSQDIFENYEIIIVDDGSKDRSSEILKEIRSHYSNIKAISHHKNLGYGRALISGVQSARYPLFFFMDADGQFNISEIDKLISHVEDYDIITGYRHNRKDSFYRVMLGKIYSWLVFLLFGLKLKDINCGFKLFKRETLNLENMYNSNGGVFYTKIFLKAKGYKIKEVPVEHFPRLKGKQTGASPRVIFDAMIDLIKLKYSSIRDKIKS
jgi:glycosyltransferase involved in cell wall biosynthesis